MIKSAIQYGVYLGLALIIYSLILYLSGPAVYGNWILGLLTFGVLIFFMVFFTIKVRKNELGGFMTYMESLKTMLVIMAISMGILTVYNILLYNVIDPELGVQVKEMAIERTVEMMERFGVPEEAMEEALTEMDNMEEQFTAGGQILQYGKTLIFMAIVCLLFALIPKKLRPTQEGLDA